MNLKLLVTASLLNLLVVSTTLVAYSYMGPSSSGDTPVNIQPSLNQIPSRAPTSSQQNSNQPKNSQGPQTATQQNDPISQPTTPPSKPTCLVKIYDAVYDLEPFRQVHSGGDIFQCNTDMTAVFSSQHSDNYLSALAQYRVQ